MSDPRREHGQLIQVFRVCTAFGLSRADRLEIATVLLDRNVDTFKSLSTIEVDRIWYAFNGAALVAKLLMERRKGERV